MGVGFVYALRSDTCRFVKIGRTDNAPMQRIRQINQSEPYKTFAPWHLIDCRKVIDAVSVERFLHGLFENQKTREIERAQELFQISAAEARAALEQLSDEQLADFVPISRLRLQPDFLRYLESIFRASGLENFIDYQESWTFSLFPSTAGGRFFTLNIDRHEVAFSRPLENSDFCQHFVVLDALILDFEATAQWLSQRSGGFFDASENYKSAKEGAVTAYFEGSMDQATSFFKQPGVRRAMLAYWYDALLDLRDRQGRSLFARFHNHNAVSELFRFMREQEAQRISV